MANQIVHPEGKYTIAQVGPSRNWDFTGKDGTNIAMTTYSLQLQGLADWVDYNIKAGGTAPTVGEVLEGHVEDAGKYGFKFTKKSGGGKWGGGGGRDYSVGAQWANAYETAAAVLGSYFVSSGTKPASIKDYLAKLDELAPQIRGLIDARIGAAKSEETPKTESESGESPATAKEVVIDGISDSELGDW